MSKALSGFRQLLKSSRYVFSGDSRAVAAARVQLRDEFLKNKDVSDAATLKDLYKGIQEVDEMLRFNIVQGERNERGNYGVKLTTENKVTTLARPNSTHPNSIFGLKYIREANENSILVPSLTPTHTLPSHSRHSRCGRQSPLRMQVSMEEGNKLPLGSDFEPIDPSFGQGVTVERIKGKKVPYDPVQP